jgi:hypothetical protein
MCLESRIRDPLESVLENVSDQVHTVKPGRLYCYMNVPTAAMNSHLQGVPMTPSGLEAALTPLLLGVGCLCMFSVSVMLLDLLPYARNSRLHLLQH